MEKVCRRCRNSKPASEFYEKPGKKDQLHTYCKDCFKNYQKKYHKKIECSCGKILYKNYLKPHQKLPIHSYLLSIHSETKIQA